MGVMLMIGVGEIEVMKVKLVSNLLKTKFLSSMKFNIKQGTKYVADE